MGACGTKNDVQVSSNTSPSKILETTQTLNEFLESSQYTSAYNTLINASEPVDKKYKYLAEKFQMFLRKHAGIVTSVSVSPDKSCFATSSKDRTVRFWDINKKKQINEMTHNKEINQVVISPNMSQVITLSNNSEVAVWSINSSKVEKVFDKFEYHIGSIQMAGDHREVFLGGGYLPQQNTCPIRVLNIVTGQETFMYEGHRAAANQMIFFNNNKNFISCSGGQYMTVDDNSVRFWEVNSPEPLFNYSNFTNSVNSVSLSPLLKQIYSGSKDGSIHVLDYKLKKLNVFRGHTSGVTCLTLTKNEDFLISGAQDSTIKLWDLKNQWMSFEFKISSVHSIACLGDFIIAGGVCSIKLLDINVHSETGLPGHHGEIEFIKIKKGSPFILTGSVGKNVQDKSIQIWNLFTRMQEGVINQAPVFSDVELNSDGTGVLFRMEDGSVRGYSLRGTKRWVNRNNRFDFYLMAKNGIRVR